MHTAAAQAAGPCNLAMWGPLVHTRGGLQAYLTDGSASIAKRFSMLLATFRAVQVWWPC